VRREVRTVPRDQFDQALAGGAKNPERHIKETEELARELMAGNSADTLARVLLGGYVDHPRDGRPSSEERPLPRHKYLKPREEGPYRFALAALLRGDSPLSRSLRDRLADLIYPDEFPCDREMVFRSKRKGAKRDSTYNSAIAGKILERVRRSKSIEAAILSVAEDLGFEPRQIWRVWGNYRPIFKALGHLEDS
jgi:hypothetical protein